MNSKLCDIIYFKSKVTQLYGKKILYLMKVGLHLISILTIVVMYAKNYFRFHIYVVII